CDHRKRPRRCARGCARREAVASSRATERCQGYTRLVIARWRGGPWPRLCACLIEHDAGRSCDQRHGYAGRRTEEKQGSFAHHHPRTFWPSFTAHHGPGSTGTPPLRNSTYSTGWLTPPALATADWAPSPMTATGSPVNTNCPKSTDIRSIPASRT